MKVIMIRSEFNLVGIWQMKISVAVFVHQVQFGLHQFVGRVQTGFFGHHLQVDGLGTQQGQSWWMVKYPMQVLGSIFDTGANGNRCSVFDSRILHQHITKILPQ